MDNECTADDGGLLKRCSGGCDDEDSGLGRRGGYSGGDELGGGYGGFGAGGLGAYRDKRDAYIDQGAALEGQEASVMTDYIIKILVLEVFFALEINDSTLFLEWKMWRRLQSTQGDCEGKTSGSIEGVGESSKKSHRQVELLSPIPKPPSLKKKESERKRSPNSKRRRRVDKAVELRNELASRNPENGALASCSGDPCLPLQWEGLQCEPISDKSFIIVSIDVSSKGLNRSIPTVVAELTHLKYL
ncbi:hypothetical protein Sjap_003325 [Stephania japonica]|uniref:Uncharacterized protein n=1 Tax=Stephania japonica TaxID=461633 RepID=A0AAP0PUY6_9MAGN